MNLPSLRRKQRAAFPTISLTDWTNQMYGAFNYGGSNYPLLGGSTLGVNPQEEPPGDYLGYVSYLQQVQRQNGVVFACMLARMLHFAEARFLWQHLDAGRPTDYHYTKALEIMERPWPKGQTGDLLARSLVDVDLAGNFFCARKGNQLYRLRPDWVTIIMGSNQDPDTPAYAWDAEIIGFYYRAPQDPDSEMGFLPGEVAHWAPIPDPYARFRGMSWLTPVLREIQADNAMSLHQRKYFEQGAAQPLDAAIATPSGWRAMGDMTVGDKVLGPDGEARHVVGVYPQGEKDIYRVTFSDDVSTECCEDHLWTVANIADRRAGKTRTMPLRDIIPQYDSGPLKWSIPLTEPVVYEQSAPLPINPYLLGALLGDGSFRQVTATSGGVSFSSAIEDSDWNERELSEMVPAGVSMARRDRGACSEFYFRAAERGDPRLPNPLTRLVREMGLAGVPSYEKSIPDEYMRADPIDRVAVLQGLIDTDGHVEPGTTGVRFTSTSETLSRQVSELGRSLGGVASCNCDSGRNIEGRRPQWHVKIGRLPAWIIPCRLERKRAAYRATFRGGEHRHRYIKTIEKVRRAEAQCIKVDCADGLYLTDDFIVTHNTPNIVVTLDPNVSEQAYKRWVRLMREETEGVENAYRTMWLGAGAEPHVIGANLQDFKTVKGHGETRIAAAAGVPPIIVGLSEGLSASTYSNYGQARRHFGDSTLRWLWRTFAGAMEDIVTPPKGSRLWYDLRDVAFMREDESDRAEIQRTESASIRTLIDAGFEPDTVVSAVLANDWGQLAHSGLYSVQLQPPGTSFKPQKPLQLGPGPAGTEGGVILPGMYEMDKLTRNGNGTHH